MSGDLDKGILRRLCCPDDHSPLHLADEREVADLEARRLAGQLLYMDGTTVHDPVAAALIRADGRRAYLVLNGIPRLSPDLAIPL